MENQQIIILSSKLCFQSNPTVVRLFTHHIHVPCVCKTYFNFATRIGSAKSNFPILFVAAIHVGHFSAARRRSTFARQKNKCISDTNPKQINKEANENQSYNYILFHENRIFNTTIRGEEETIIIVIKKIRASRCARYVFRHLCVFFRFDLSLLFICLCVRRASLFNSFFSFFVYWHVACIWHGVRVGLRHPPIRRYIIGV